MEQPAAHPPHLGVGQAEDAGVVGAPHHDLVLLARAMAAALSSRSLGTVALPGHTLAGGVSHGCSSSRGQPAAGTDTQRGTPPLPRQERRGPAPEPGKGIPAAGGRARGPLPYPLRGTPQLGEPSPEAPLPHSPGPADPHAAHLRRCAKGSGAKRTPAVRRTRRPIKLLKLKPHPKPAIPVSS